MENNIQINQGVDFRIESNVIPLKIKKLNELAKIPVKAHEDDACYDLYCTSVSIDEYGNIRYGTGLSFEIPSGYEMEIRPRSSISKYNLMLINSPGTIDSNYRGEIFLNFRFIGGSKDNLFSIYDDKSNEFITTECLTMIFTSVKESSIYKVGERIAQFKINKVLPIQLIEADQLSETERGNGGFGSTGTN